MKNKYTVKFRRWKEYKLNKHCNLQFNTFSEIWFFCEENNINSKRIGRKFVKPDNWGHDFREKTKIEETKTVFYIKEIEAKRREDE